MALTASQAGIERPNLQATADTLLRGIEQLRERLETMYGRLSVSPPREIAGDPKMAGSAPTPLPPALTVLDRANSALRECHEISERLENALG